MSFSSSEMDRRERGEAGRNLRISITSRSIKRSICVESRDHACVRPGRGDPSTAYGLFPLEICDGEAEMGLLRACLSLQNQKLREIHYNF